jgi:flotillin
LGTALAVAAAMLGAFALSRYQRCSPNEVIVVFGLTGSKKAKLVHGGGTFVWPIIQEFRTLQLEPFAVEVPLEKALSLEKVRVSVPSVFTLAVGTEQNVMYNASLRLLDMDHDGIEHQALEIITGQLRQVIASMTIEQINRDRERFENTIRSHVGKELEKVGLVLINVNITNIEDDSGVIEAMGRKATAEVVQRAEVDVATHNKEGAIGKSLQERDMQIGVAENEQMSAVRTAELYATQQQGENTAAKTIAESNSELQIAKASAYERGEVKERQAKAAVLEAESRALAQSALAEAERVEAEKRSEFEAPAKAMKAKIIVDSEAQAEQSRIEAEGEAQAAFLKYEAEARGNYELLARKAEGLGMIVRESGGPQEAFRLMMIDSVPHLAETSAKAISNIKFDKVVVWDGGNSGGGNGDGGGGPTATSNFIRGMTHGLPPAMDVLRHVGGIDGLDKLLLADGGKGDAAQEAMLAALGKAQQGEEEGDEASEEKK